MASRAEGLYKVKGSKHFGYAFPVRTENDIKEKLELIRKEHHAARHHAYAWRLGPEGKRYRANDDGEPSNSAGKPILGQLQSYDLTYTLVIVVRYFGGTKLGVGGLIDAYRTAAKAAIDNGQIVEKQVTADISVDFPYDAMGGVMRVLKEFSLEMREHTFEFKCNLVTDVRLSEVEAVLEAFSDIDFVEAEVVEED